MSEEKKAKSVGLPATDEATQLRNYMKAGMHLCKIREIVEWVDDKGQPKKDKNGNPGIKIVFYTRGEDKDGAAIEPEMEANYYYSPLPITDPSRNDPSKVCKSEFKLTKAKQALGFGTGEVKAPEAKKAKVWVAVKLQEIVDQDGQPVYKDGKPVAYHIVEDLFPYKADEKVNNFGRQNFKGDPETDPGNFKSGYFFEQKKQTIVKPASDDAPLSPGPSESPITQGDVAAAPTKGDDW